MCRACVPRPPAALRAAASKGNPATAECPACKEAGIRHSHRCFDPQTVIANHALQRMMETTQVLLCQPLLLCLLWHFYAQSPASGAFLLNRDARRFTAGAYDSTAVFGPHGPDRGHACHRLPQGPRGSARRGWRPTIRPQVKLASPSETAGGSLSLVVSPK
jgi:hypothetical protein